MKVKRKSSRRVTTFFTLCGLLSICVLACSPSVLGDAPNIKISPDLVYGHKDGLAMTMDKFTPAKDPNGAALLFMVSGGWVSQWGPPESYQPFLQPYLDKGYTVFAVRHGSSPRYVVPEVISDVRKALEYVSSNAEKLDIDRDRIGIFGFSAGGHLSLVLGTSTNHIGQPSDSPRVAAVATVFPPSDLKPYIHDEKLREQFPALKFDEALVEDCSPLFHASKDDAPALMIHGDKDELVPLFHSQKMAEALKGVAVPTELIVVEGAGHGFDQSQQKEAFEAMARWFDTHLAPKGKPAVDN